MEQFLNFTLFGSGIAFGILLLALFIALIWADIEEVGWAATVSVIIAIGLNYFWGDFPILKYLTFYNIAGYLFIGFLFSIIRTYFKGKELGDKTKKTFNLRDNVFRWWFLWWICAINWIVGRLIADAWNWIFDKLGGMYRSIFGI